MKVRGKILRCFLLGTLAAALPGAMYAQGIRFERFTMPSGLQVIVHTDQRAPVVSVALAYKSGLNDEPSTLSGINEAVAAMRTESSPHLSPGQHASIVGTYGGRTRVDVGYDATLFSDSFSSNMLKGAIWLASEKAYDFRADSAAFRRVLETVGKAGSSRRRDPEQRERQVLYDMVRTVNLRLVPDVAVLDSGLTLRAAKSYEQLYFNPRNAVLAVSGDVNVDSVRRYVVEMFSLLPADTVRAQLVPTVFSVQRPAADTVKLAGGRAVDVGSGILAMTRQAEHTDTLYMPQMNESVVFAWQIPPFDDPQSVVFDFIGTVLAGGSGSRLHRVLVEEEEIAVGVETFSLPMRRASVFAFKVDLRPGVKIEEAESAIRAEIDRMKNFTISTGELKKAVNAERMSWLQTVSSNEGMARMLALTQLMHGDAAEFSARVEKLPKITAEELQGVVRRFLRNDNLKIIYELPASQGPKEPAKAK